MQIRKKNKKKNDEKPVNGVFENEHREQTFQRISQHCKRNSNYYENKRSLKPIKVTNINLLLVNFKRNTSVENF